MHRVIVYDSALPQTTDILNTNKFMMLGQSFLNIAVLGSGPVIQGLACTPTAPASLQVVVGPGSIYAQDEVDATAYGDLGTDTNSVVKQGILYTGVNLTVTPPTTAGYSQVYVVEVILQDVDAGAQVLSYYDSANPAVPFSGPNNDGASQFTQRTCVATVALKAGVAAPTGTQVTPSPDAGYTALYAITVTNGQSTITSANIVQLTTAPIRNDNGGAAYFPTLPQVPPAVQNGQWVGFDDTSGAANTVTITPYPPVAALQKYQKFRVKVAHTNTGSSTLQIVNSTTTLSGAIQLPSGAALQGGELHTGSIAEFVYDGTLFELVSFPANGSLTGGGGLPPVIYEVGFSGLSGSAAGGTKTASWTAQQLNAATSLGSATAYYGSSVSLSFNGSTTGAGGMDTGAMPTSADLSVYAIYNPTSATWNTLGCAGSTSNGPCYTGTHLPAGYTASVLIWAGVTDSSSNVKQFQQVERQIWIISANVLTNGVATSSTSISLSSCVPATAKFVAGNWATGSGSGGSALSSTPMTGGGFPFNTDLGFQYIGTTAGTLGNYGTMPMVTPQTLYYATSTGLQTSIAVDQYTI